MIGEEGDTRKYAKAKKTDYSAGIRAALEVKPVTKWVRCAVCKQPIKGQNFNGYCLRCFDEPM